MVTMSENCDKRVEEIEEHELATKLKQICNENGKEQDCKESARILHQLGRVYQKRAPDKFSLIRSAALYNAAIARAPDNMKEILQDLKQLCKQILLQADAEHRDADLVNESQNIKVAIQDMRSRDNEKLNLIEKIPDDIETTKLTQLENDKISSVKKLQDEITDNYKTIMANVAKYCEGVMGRPPCNFALAGMGSLARKEITPYSDFENIILLKDSVKTRTDYRSILSYFKWFSVLFHVILINLQETIIPSVAIASLNNKRSKLGDWFFDGVTTRGISFDGMMPHACKFPLGSQQLSKNKQFELIKPVSEMLKYLSSEGSLNTGYHLSDILTKTCFVYKNKKVFAAFEREVFNFLQKSSEADRLKEVTSQVVDDLAKFATRPVFSLAERNNPINIKHVVYRSISLFISALGRAFNIHASSCFDIVTGLAEKRHINKKMTQKLMYATAMACEIRLKWYMQNKRQSDDMDSIQTLLDIVGKTSITSFFQIVYSLQCDISKRWQLKKVHFYSHPLLLNLGLACSFNDVEEVIKFIQKNDEFQKLLGRFHDFNDCLSQLEKHKKKVTKQEVKTFYILNDKIGFAAKIIQHLAVNLLKKSHFDDAIFCFNKSTEMFQEHGQTNVDNEICFNQFHTAECYCGMLKFAEALPYFDKSIYTKQPLITLAWKLYEHGRCFLRLNRLEKALENFKASLKIKQQLSVDLERDIHVGLILRETGICLKSYPYKAKIYFEQALAIFQQSSSKSDKLNLAQTLLEFGDLLQSTNDADNATALIDKSLQLFNETSADPEQDPNVMQCKVELGRRLLELKKPEKAKEVFENALKLFKHISLDADSDIRVAQAAYMKFQALYDMNKFEDGLSQVEIALEIFQRSSDNSETDSEVYKTLLAKGKCLIEMKRFEEATWIFVEAAKVYQHISVLKHINFDETSSHLLEHISVCLMNTNNFKDAFIFLHEAQQIQLQRTHDTSSERATFLAEAETKMMYCLAKIAKESFKETAKYRLKNDALPNGDTLYTLFKAHKETTIVSQVIQRRVTKQEVKYCLDDIKKISV